jgi:hypothetical protein
MSLEKKSDLMSIAKNLVILSVAIVLIPYLSSHYEVGSLLPHLSQSLVLWVVFAIPAIVIGWIALHIGLFVFKTLFPR